MFFMGMQFRDGIFNPCYQGNHAISNCLLTVFAINSLTLAKVPKDLVNQKVIKRNNKESIREFLKSVLKWGLDMIEDHRKEKEKEEKY